MIHGKIVSNCGVDSVFPAPGGLPHLASPPIVLTLSKLDFCSFLQGIRGMFKGSITALITPFKNGAVDEDRLQSYVEWQIEEGTNGLVPVGTTGESPTLSHEEHKRVVELCVEVANKRVPVIAGAGSNSTDE